MTVYKKERKERADERKSLREERSDEQQLASLDKRGFAATKERARLAARIAKRK